MDMNPALVPYLLSPVGSSSSTIQTAEDGAARGARAEPAASNVAFYFRNWPFPVDMAEAATGDGSLRSWQERLASYREASKTVVQQKTRAAEGEAAKDEAAPAGPAISAKPAAAQQSPAMTEIRGAAMGRSAPVEELATPGPMAGQDTVGSRPLPGQSREVARGTG